MDTVLGVIVIIAIVAVVVVAIIAILSLRRRKANEATQAAVAKAERAQEAEDQRYASQDRPIKEWLEKIDNAPDDQAIVDVGEPPAGWRERWESDVQSALRDQVDASKRLASLVWQKAEEERRTAAATTLMARLRGETDTSKQYTELYSLLNGDAYEDEYDYISTEDMEWAEQQLDSLKDTIGNDLLESARGGDRAAFKTLVELKKNGEWPKSEDSKLPADWNDLVAQFVKDPDSGDFKGVDDWDLSTVKLLLKAAEALRTHSLTKAKMVLAYCDYEDLGEELGVIYLTELTKMVDELWSQLPHQTSKVTTPEPTT